MAQRLEHVDDSSPLDRRIPELLLRGFDQIPITGRTEARQVGTELHRICGSSRIQKLDVPMHLIAEDSRLSAVGV